MIPRPLFSAEHDLFRDMVRRFIAAEITPRYAGWEKDGIVPRDVWLKAGEVGLLCPTVPEEYGGPGGDFLHSAVVIEEMAIAGAMALSGFYCSPERPLTSLGTFAEWSGRLSISLDCKPSKTLNEQEHAFVTGIDCCRVFLSGRTQETSHEENLLCGSFCCCTFGGRKFGKCTRNGHRLRL